MYPQPRFSGRRLAVLGVLAALSLAVHTIESAFPPLFGIPGAKLGLSNLFSMLALVVYGPLDALLILLARTLLGALIAGNASSLLFSLSGGGAALLVGRRRGAACLHPAHFLCRAAGELSCRQYRGGGHAQHRAGRRVCVGDFHSCELLPSSLLCPRRHAFGRCRRGGRAAAFKAHPRTHLLSRS